MSHSDSYHPSSSPSSVAFTVKIIVTIHILCTWWLVVSTAEFM